MGSKKEIARRHLIILDRRNSLPPRRHPLLSLHYRKNLIVISLDTASSASCKISVASASLAVSKLIPTPQLLQTSR
jgi:hypothetical protein